MLAGGCREVPQSAGQQNKTNVVVNNVKLRYVGYSVVEAIDDIAEPQKFKWLKVSFQILVV